MSVINSVGTLAAYTVDNMVKISLQIAVRLMFVAPWLYAVLLCGTVGLSVRVAILMSILKVLVPKVQYSTVLSGCSPI